MIVKTVLFLTFALMILTSVYAGHRVEDVLRRVRREGVTLNDGRVCNATGQTLICKYNKMIVWYHEHGEDFFVHDNCLAADEIKYGSVIVECPQ